MNTYSYMPEIIWLILNILQQSESLFARRKEILGDQYKMFDLF